MSKDFLQFYNNPLNKISQNEILSYQMDSDEILHTLLVTEIIERIKEEQPKLVSQNWKDKYSVKHIYDKGFYLIEKRTGSLFDYNIIYGPYKSQTDLLETFVYKNA